MLKKNYTINILLIAFSLLLLLTLKTTFFNTVSYYLFILDFKEQALYVTDFYIKYLFNNTNLNNGCAICDELAYRFPFDNILFKFALLNTTTLLLIKYRKQQWTLTSEDIFFIPLILCFCVYICYVDTFNNNMFNIFHFNYTNIVQYIIFVTYTLSIFVYYPLIVLFLWKDNKLIFELKIFYLILITYFIIFFKADCFIFLYTSGNSLDVNHGINYILQIYNFPVIECMKRETLIEPKPSDASIVANFIAENAYLRERVEILERELNFNIELRNKEKIHFESHIKILEENQGHLIAEIRSLKDQAIEDNEIFGEMVGDNIDLRSEAAERQESYETSKRGFESARKQYEEATDELHKSKKQR